MEQIEVRGEPRDGAGAAQTRAQTHATPDPTYLRMSAEWNRKKSRRCGRWNRQVSFRAPANHRCEAEQNPEPGLRRPRSSNAVRCKTEPSARWRDQCRPGTSVTAIRPWRRQPTLNSHVRALDTGGSCVSNSTTRKPHPSNQRPEDAGSTRGSGSIRCLDLARWHRAFSSTYAIELRTSRGERRTCRWKRSASTLPCSPNTPATACPDRLHARGEVPTAGCFDDEMHVVSLQCVVNHAKPRALANRPQAPFELAHEANRAERRDATAQLQRDVAGVRGAERLATSVRIARLRPVLAPGAFAAAAPGRRRAESQREWAGGSRHGNECVTAS